MAIFDQRPGSRFDRPLSHLRPDVTSDPSLRTASVGEVRCRAVLHYLRTKEFEMLLLEARRNLKNVVLQFGRNARAIPLNDNAESLRLHRGKRDGIQIRLIPKTVAIA